MGAGLLETRELKSVTVGIRWRGRRDVIGDRSDERELEVKVIEDPVVDGSEVLEFELNRRRINKFLIWYRLLRCFVIDNRLVQLVDGS